MAEYTHDHEHVFAEEQEPSGRLVLPPCLVCGFPAIDAINLLRCRIVEHHNIRWLSDEAIHESLGGDCEICLSVNGLERGVRQ